MFYSVLAEVLVQALWLCDSQKLHVSIQTFIYLYYLLTVLHTYW